MIPQVYRFSLIGVAATFIHMLVGVTLIHGNWPPLAANVAAFAIAFLVGFAGHFGYTFSAGCTSLPASLLRFILLALLGFAVNEAMLAGLLTRDLLSPALALMLSTGLVAVGSFVLSRPWAVAPS